MGSDDTKAKAPWERPDSVALTEPDSRADDADVLLRNGTTIGSTPG